MFETIQFIQENPNVFYILVGMFSLLVGSFLNVVIHRLPIILNNEWRQQCHDFLKIEVSQSPEKITLNSPASHCPTCHSKIKWYQNIPVFSWAMLRGKCGNCRHPISIRYPLIEVLTCLGSVGIALAFGSSIQALSLIVLYWGCIVLFFIDNDHQILPDRIVFPLLGLGLFLGTQNVFISAEQSIYGAIIGFLCLWIVCALFKLFTGKEGMGQGDFKLLAVFGAWGGALLLPYIILMSSIIGCIIGAALYIKHKESRPFAFGTAISVSGIIILIYNYI